VAFAQGLVIEHVYARPTAKRQRQIQTAQLDKTSESTDRMAVPDCLEIDFFSFLMMSTSIRKFLRV
jgi:hypothetical protein